MLKLINLYVIDKIFNEDSLIKIGSRAKMLYLNCITHHFRNKTATNVNSIAFSIPIMDIKNYNIYRNDFLELESAELINIENDKIKFINHWGKHIDRTLLDKVAIEEYLGSYSKKLASQFTSEINNNTKLLELLQMKHKIDLMKVNKLIDMFIKEKDAINNTYNNFQECCQHLMYWVNTNVDKAQGQRVVSTAKVLGVKKR